MPRWAVVVPSLLAAMLVLVATRHDPLLSPDSITYLSAADHIRGGHGITDFTLEPLSVFGPIYPLLLSPGGRSLLWASIVGATAIAAGTALMWLLLRYRVRPIMAIGGALALGASQGLVRVASVVWSEAPYAAISLVTIAVLSRKPITTRIAVIGGLLAGIGFLTRYAGLGLIATGAAIVVASTWRQHGRVVMIKRTAAFAAGAMAISSVWVIRNLVETGQPLGPRFEGGASEPVSTTIRLAFRGTGNTVFGDGWSATASSRLGITIFVAIVIVAAFALRGRKSTTLDVGMLAFAITSFVVPIIARRITANDIELRVMSPMLIPVVYFAAVMFDRLCTVRIAAVGALAALGWWVYVGVAFAARFPDLAPGSSGYKPQFSPQMYDVIDRLPADATVLTDNPQRVWWFTDREPTLFAFTRPRPGNSHYPLDAAHTVAQACSGHAYLAWFDGLANAGGGPAERRPDLMKLVDLQQQQSVSGGELYLLVPRDPSKC
jgi:hypothetical protein